MTQSFVEMPERVRWARMHDIRDLHRQRAGFGAGGRGGGRRATLDRRAGEGKTQCAVADALRSAVAGRSQGRWPRFGRASRRGPERRDARAAPSGSFGEDRRNTEPKLPSSLVTSLSQSFVRPRRAPVLRAILSWVRADSASLQTEGALNMRCKPRDQFPPKL
jgi:hypothetical protein